MSIPSPSPMADVEASPPKVEEVIPSAEPENQPEKQPENEPEKQPESVAEPEIVAEPEVVKPKPGPSPEYHVERKMLRDVLMSSGQISHSAVISWDDQVLQAAGPPDFVPEPENINHIIKAFDGDIMGLAENGVALGCGLPMYVPGKMLEGRIVCSDGKGGGVVLFRTALSLIIVVYQKDPTVATRLGFKVVEHIRQLDR